MKRFKLHHKAIAILVTLTFLFQSMSDINSHTYTTGIDSYHYQCGCFSGCHPDHLAVKCDLGQYHIL
jgi:hypothetical protein